MPIITQHNPNFSTSAQITPQDVAQIAQDGFKTIINNRPDAEGGADQPLSADIAAAAQVAGVVYYHLPVIPAQYSAEQIAQMRAFIADAPKPIFAFCRSGARAKQLYDLANAG